jgi:alkanesulfonate monooxygenase SsuD/methylene tetrahydromethanopterin reductase-like flavin-dependent oxidoreductase (luciferase family)
VGLHSLGYVAESTEKAVMDYYPGYKQVFTKIGQERGFAPVTKERFDAQNSGPQGALLVGSPEDVAEKIFHHSEALGGISRVTFQMDVGIPHDKLLNSIALIGDRLNALLNN